MRTLAFVLVICLAQSSDASTPRRHEDVSSKVSQASAANSLQCKKLVIDYDETSKDLATNKVAGALDESAIRQGMRDTQDGNSLRKSQMILDLMKSSKCNLPNYVPDAMRYYSEALDCETERSKQRAKTAGDEFVGRPASPVADPRQCDRSQWKPLEL